MTLRLRRLLNLDCSHLTEFENRRPWDLMWHKFDVRLRYLLDLRVNGYTSSERCLFTRLKSRHILLVPSGLFTQTIGDNQAELEGSITPRSAMSINILVMTSFACSGYRYIGDLHGLSDTEMWAGSPEIVPVSFIKHKWFVMSQHNQWQLFLLISREMRPILFLN